MTYIVKAAAGDETERAKWREQANKAAAHLKGMTNFGENITFEPMFAFDDGSAKLSIPISFIQLSEQAALAEWIFKAVLQQTDHRAAGESADAQAPGMECGHAAPQAPDRNPETPLRPSGTGQPAVAAVPERCWRHTPPDFTEQCGFMATGGVRLKLFPHERFIKRYGKRPMINLLLDLPVCAECFAKMTPAEVITNLEPGMWGAFCKEAQRKANGILPLKENSEIEHLPFDDPEYVMRRQMAKDRAANDSQPAPAGPQPEGAGDGT